MPSTANGLKATAVRGCSWVYIVESAHRVEFVEVKPGLRIEDIDTTAYVAPGFENWTFATHVEARKLDRRDCEDGAEPGWYVQQGSDWYGPITSKADAIRHMRADLAENKNWYWQRIHEVNSGDTAVPIGA